MSRNVLMHYGSRSVCICVYLRLIPVLAMLQASAALAANTMYPVPEGAYEVGQSVIRPGRTVEDRFSIRLAFPSTTVIDHYRRYFSPLIECRGRGTAWETGPDPSTNAPKFIHQLAKIWVTEDNREVVTLAIRYTSSGVEWKDKPDNDVQDVTVLYEKVMDARQAARAKGVSCDETSAPMRRSPNRGPTIMR